MKYTLDAQNKKVGRIASEAAKLLMGKNLTTFVRNAVPDVDVEIINAGKADISEQRKEKEVKPRYSGYPSGIKVQTVGEVLEKKGPQEVFRKAVYGMLPTNKLRAKMIKRLKISE
ncbi:MAG: uL13 family ribosomal protein [Patescibacteria group bacterium]